MPSTLSPDALVAYVPVIHRGYIELFGRFRDAKSVFVLGTELLAEEDYLRKELRAIAPEQAAELIGCLGIFKSVSVATKRSLQSLNDSRASIVLPDEDVSRLMAERYLNKANTQFHPVFLRWDRHNVDGVNRQHDDVRTSSSKGDVGMMTKAYLAAERSPDIWRRVGAVLAGSGFEWRSSNQPLTAQNTPWVEGDPRNVFKRGVGVEMSTFMHAEASLIAQAAREGRSLVGATMWVTTFPCPPCAMLIAKSGIKRCCFSEGYAMLDGRRVLEEASVEMVRIEGDFPVDERPLVPYPNKSS